MSPAPRIAPANPPFHVDAEAAIARLTPPGRPPLRLFATLARDPRLFARFIGGGLLDRGHLTIRQREIVIHRVAARCKSHYEWGVHVAFFADRAGFDDRQLQSLAHGAAADSCWSANEALLLRFCDSLHETCDIGDSLWGELSAAFADEALLELILLAGFYRTTSYLTNALRLPLESYASSIPPAHDARRAK